MRGERTRRRRNDDLEGRPLPVFLSNLQPREPQLINGLSSTQDGRHRRCVSLNVERGEGRGRERERERTMELTTFASLFPLCCSFSRDLTSLLSNWSIMPEPDTATSEYFHSWIRRRSRSKSEGTGDEGRSTNELTFPPSLRSSFFAEIIKRVRAMILKLLPVQVDLEVRPIS